MPERGEEHADDSNAEGSSVHQKAEERHSDQQQRAGSPLSYLRSWNNSASDTPSQKDQSAANLPDKSSPGHQTPQQSTSDSTRRSIAPSDPDGAEKKRRSSTPLSEPSWALTLCQRSSEVRGENSLRRGTSQPTPSDSSSTVEITGEDELLVTTSDDYASTQSSDLPTSLQSQLPTVPSLPSDYADLIRRVKANNVPISSTIANVTAVSACFPLDTIKTLVQTAPQKMSALHCARMVLRKEGPMGFYRGGLLTVLTASTVRSAGFSIYGYLQHSVSRSITRLGYPAPIDSARRPGTLPTPLTALNFGLAGFGAGCVQAALACPFELTKIAAQLSAKSTGSASSSKGSVATANQIYAKLGLAGFYTGFTRHLVRDSIGTGVYFAAYESFKQTINYARGDKGKSTAVAALAGFGAGVTGWTVTYPLDRLKTKFQEARLNAGRGELITIERVDVLTRKAWEGFHLSALRSAIVSAITFTVLEQTKRRIDEL